MFKNKNKTVSSLILSSLGLVLASGFSMNAWADFNSKAVTDYDLANPSVTNAQQFSPDTTYHTNTKSIPNNASATNSNQANVGYVTDPIPPKLSHVDIGFGLGVGYKYYPDKEGNKLFSGLLADYSVVNFTYYFPALKNNLTFTTGLEFNLGLYGMSGSGDDNNNSSYFNDDYYSTNDDYNAGLNIRPVITFGIGSYRPTVGKLNLSVGIGGGWGYYSLSSVYKDVGYFTSSYYLYKYRNISKVELSFSHSLLVAQASLNYQVGNIALGFKYIFEKEHIYNSTFYVRYNDNKSTKNYDLDKNYNSHGVVFEITMYPNF